MVAGALVLAHVEAAVAKRFLRCVSTVVVAKFHAPLKPSVCFAIELARKQDDTIDFRVVAAATLIASGRLRLSAARDET